MSEAAEDIIVAELRLKIDKMEADAVAAEQRIETLSKNLKKQGSSAGKDMADGLSAGLGKANSALVKTANVFVTGMRKMQITGTLSFTAMAQGISTAIRSIPIIGWITMIISALQALGNIIGGAIAKNKQAKEEAKIAADAQKVLNGTFEDISEEQQKRQEKEQKAEEKARKAEEKKIKAQEEARKAEEAKKKAMESIIKVAKNVVKSNENLGKAVDLAGKAYKKTKDEATKFGKKLLDDNKLVGDAVNKYRDLKGSASELSDKMKKTAEATEKAAEAKKKAKEEAKILKQVNKQLKESNQALIDSYREMQKSISGVQGAFAMGLSTTEEARRAEAEAIQKHINTLQENWVTIRELRDAASGFERNIHQNNLNDIYNQVQRLSDERNGLIKEANDLQAGREKRESINTGRLNAIKAESDARKKADEEYAMGMISREQKDKKHQDAKLAYYQALQSIVAEHGDAVDADTKRLHEQARINAGNIINLENQEAIKNVILSQEEDLIKQEVQRLNNQANSIEAEDERNKKLQEAIDLENTLIEKQREREKAVLMASNEYTRATDEQKKIMLDNFDALTEGLKKKLEEMNGGMMTLGKALKENASQLLSSAMDVFNEIAAASTAVLEREINKQIELLDEQYERKKELLDKELQDKLYALGLIEAATEEHLEQDLQKAIETGCHRQIFEAETAHKKFMVEQEYAEKQKKLEEETNREKAEMQHRLEIAQWKQKKLSSLATVAQSIMVAAASMAPPYNLIPIAMAGAIGAAQMIALEQAKPVLQFSRGGIVPGTSYTGDKIQAGLNSREAVFTLEQQKKLFDMANTGSSGSGTVTLNIPVILDSKVVTNVVVDNINNRIRLIKKESVV